MRRNPKKTLATPFPDGMSLHEAFRLFFAKAADGVFILDKKGKIIALNREAKRLLKIKEMKVGNSFRSSSPRKIISIVAKAVFDSKKKGIQRFEFDSENRIGNPTHLDITVRPFRSDKKIIGVFGIIHDVTKEKEATEASETAMQRFQFIIENSHIGIGLIDSRFKIIYVNNKALGILGYSRKEVVGHDFRQFLDAESRSLFQKCHPQKNRRRKMTHEFRIARKNGERRDIVIKSVAQSDWKDEVQITMEMLDVTGNKRNEEALRTSEEKYRSLFENAPDVIYSISANGIITSLNPAFEKITGWQRSKWLGKPFKQLIHPNDLEFAFKTLKEILQGKSLLPYELRICSKSGDYLVGEFTSKPQTQNGKIIGEFGIVRNVTERRKAEKELRASESKFRTLFQNVPDGVYQTSREGRILTANPALVNMLGYDSLEELQQVNIARDLYVNAEDRKILQKKLEEKGDLHNIELILKRKNGQKITVLENVHVVRDESDRVMHYEGTLTNIAERKALEERLSTLNSYSGKLNAADSLEQVYELILDALEKTLGFENAAYMVAEKDKLRIACQRGYPEKFLELPLDGTKKGLTVKAAITHLALLVSDVKKEEDYAEANPAVRSELTVPVEIEGKVLGVLDIESKEIGAFSEKDLMLVQILASHAAIAISNLQKRIEIENRSNQLALLMSSSAEMIHTMDLRKRLVKIAEAIRCLGWQRVVIRAVDSSSMDTLNPEDLVTAGLTKQEKRFLWDNRVPGHMWLERFGSEYERFKLGEFYHLPWNDSWVRKRFSQWTVNSKLKNEEMVDWDPQDLLYAPLSLADGRIVGILSMDDPVDGRKPTKESLAPLELFIHQAAVAIENAQLISQLEHAKNQIEEYADQLELKVEQRTKELVETQIKLLRNERLAAIGEVAAMVGHDLRNPLTGIAGATYYLKSKLGNDADSKVTEMLGIIEKDIDHSNKIINDLLDYSREIRLELKEANLKTVLEESLSFVKIPESIRINNIVQPIQNLKMDAEKMERVFINIVKNAIDAMPKGGSLTISSSEIGDRANISFSDTGIGMSEQTLEKIWSPLFTTKARGMGFGLAICKRIVEAHGGGISITSVMNKGTTVTITVLINPKVEGGGATWVNMPESLLSMMTKA